MSELGLVDPRLLRSVRLDIDWFSEDPSAHYVVSASAIDVIQKILPAAGSGARARAFTLTGPYGTGKSALALFLADLLCSEGKRRETARARFAGATKQRLSTGRFLPIFHTCTTGPINVQLREAIEEAAERYGFASDTPLEELPSAAAAAGFEGVFVILDELGKGLEFAVREPIGGDPFVLQEVAELAGRSEPPLIVLGILHQSFAGYAEGLDSAARNEWVKVQGRFQDIAFLPPEEVLAKLVSEAIGGTPPDTDELAHTAELVRSLPGIWPAPLPLPSFTAICERSWPLHPVTVAAMPVLMRRFGQNERSLFAFLVERGLLASHDRGKPVRLCDLFEHVSEWIGHGVRGHSASRRWRVALELLHARPGFDSDEREVLRTVALLTALGSFAPFTSTTEAISLALGYDASPVLHRLAQRSAIVHRRHLGAWVLWEGSDVDLESLLEKARVEIAGRANIPKLLKDIGALKPGIAQRHYEETGTLRWFDPLVLSDPDHINVPEPKDSSNCTLAIAFGSSTRAQEKFEEWAQECERQDIVVAVAHRAPRFRSLAEELEALNMVEKSNHELKGDKVAKEEIAARRATLSAALTTEAERLLDPSGPDGCVFYHGGQECAVESRRDLARVYSTVCSERFTASPQIRNELINRRSLSSAAAAARRDLLDKMLSNRSEARLGYTDGYPPDRAIYESVLLQSGLHRASSEGETWEFGAPEEGDPCKLRLLWQWLGDRLFASFPEPVPVSQLIAELAQPPSGLVEGPFPILLLAFMLAHEQEIALYREGSFIAEQHISHWELLLRRPELFSVAGCRQTGARQAALAIVCRRLGMDQVALMPPVKFVVRAIDGLPPRSKSTKSVSDRAQAVRIRALEARSPERFFFHDLPVALALEPLGDTDSTSAAEEFVDRLAEVLRELNGVVEVTRKWATGVLAREAGLGESQEGFAELLVIAPKIRERLEDPKARELCARLSSPDRETAETGALSLVAMRPVDAWTDKDCEVFESRAKALTAEIREEMDGFNRRMRSQSPPKVHEVTEHLYNTLAQLKVESRTTMIAAVKELLKKLEGDQDGR
jgi:hypothetical protein